MNAAVYIVIGGSILQFFGSLTYARNAYLGRSKPNRVTFFLWGTVPMIAVAIGLANGGWWALLPVFMAGFGPLLIFLSSFTNPNAYWKLTPFDYVCGFFAVAATLVWLSVNEPSLAIVLSICADLFAGIPTVIKCWKHPETETGIPYFIAFLTEVAGIFVLTTYSFPEYGFLVYLTLINLALFIGVYRRNPLRKLRAELAP